MTALASRRLKHFTPQISTAIALFASLLLTLTPSVTQSQTRLATLDGKPPLVIAHRGASGYLPEETLEAYARAIELGADVIEMDLVSTKDGVLITRHDANLAISTDIAQRPEFASRRKSVMVDGELQTGWFSHDFTLAEIRTLGAISTDPERPQQFNGLYKVPTFQEVVDLVKSHSARGGRSVAIYPETKHATHFRLLGLPMEDKLIAILDAAGWNSKQAPVLVQSFEPGSLQYMRSKGLKTRVVQLIGGGRPYDWTVAGDSRNYAFMTTAAGLADIKTYADGIGPWKGMVIGSNTSATPGPPSRLVADAHAARLFVHPYTFRNEQRRLAPAYQGNPQLEYLAFYRAGVDGVFTDFPDTAIAARAQFLKNLGY